MTTLTVKNLPPALYERLKEKAKANHRSLNSEVITILEKELGERSQVEVEELLEGARKIRELTAHYVATEDEINRWKREGRE